MCVIPIPMGRSLYIYILIYHKNQANVGKYTSPMDGMGLLLLVFFFVHVSNDSTTWSLLGVM